MDSPGVDPYLLILASLSTEDFDDHEEAQTNFLSLPPELRVKVYYLLFSLHPCNNDCPHDLGSAHDENTFSSSPRLNCLHDRRSRKTKATIGYSDRQAIPNVTAILLTSKLLYTEALPILYKFPFQIETCLNRLYRPILNQIGPLQRSWITNIGFPVWSQPDIWGGAVGDQKTWQNRALINIRAIKASCPSLVCVRLCLHMYFDGKDAQDMSPGDILAMVEELRGVRDVLVRLYANTGPDFTGIDYTEYFTLLMEETDYAICFDLLMQNRNEISNTGQADLPNVTWMKPILH